MADDKKKHNLYTVIDDIMNNVKPVPPASKRGNGKKHNMYTALGMVKPSDNKKR